MPAKWLGWVVSNCDAGEEGEPSASSRVFDRKISPRRELGDIGFLGFEREFVSLREAADEGGVAPGFASPQAVVEVADDEVSKSGGMEKIQERHRIPAAGNPDQIPEAGR